MQKKERIKKILNFFKKNEFLMVKNILDFFDNKIDRTTIYRDIQDLIEKNEIKEISSWKYQIKENPIKYLKKFI